jgi:AmiR/NasT family two-component response regulator
MQERIDKLEHQHALDEAVVRQLVDEGLAARTKVENLEIALVSARRIGAAVGILMARRQLTDQQAFNVLVQASQNQHRKLRDIAEDVILTGDLPQAWTTTE